jgi:hypothetical protein
MNGGPGNDIFQFESGFGTDTITGFDANPAGGQDQLDIAPLGITADTFAANVAIISGANTSVTIAADSVTLTGVDGVGANVVAPPPPPPPAGQGDFLLAA